MVKQKEDVQACLQQATSALFRERGYDRTTTAEIAARASVTKRTFLRHFSDKREMRFDGEAVLHETLTASIRDVPDDLD